MKREIITTLDGSTTIHLPDWNETYHSRHGAVQEAYHVFIKNGLSLFMGKPVAVLEVGLGTGLNAFITALEAQKNSQVIDYTGIEAYPVLPEEALSMNYPQQLGVPDQIQAFAHMHESAWEENVRISPYFSLTKRQQFFHDIADENAFDLIYFDAFGYRVQPELWSLEIFRKMFTALKPGGVLVTYACRSVIKNAMKESGFAVEKLPGAPGKREMLRATKK